MCKLSNSERNLKELGDKGEKIVSEYLEKMSFSVLERNFRCRAGEIDIIAKDGDTVVFVEVKTRKNSNYGNPCEAVNSTKQKRIIQTANYYIYKKGLKDSLQYRFDVAEVYIGSKDGAYDINIIKNAFGV